jgi:trk/ktr system potassium uptake protein
MRSFVVIGLGQFGKCMVESLVERKCDVLVIDHNPVKVEWARDVVGNAVKADALNPKLYEDVLPKGVECAVVDLGEHMEPSILATNYLTKQGIKHVVVQALNPGHGEILKLVGATRVVFPEREAAERVAGILVGRGTLDYFPIGESFSIAEVRAPKKWIGKKLRELGVRQSQNMHVIATRSDEAVDKSWALANPDRAFEPGDIVLIAGDTTDLDRIQR